MTIGTQPPSGDAGARVRNRWGQGERLRAEIMAAAGQLLGELGTVDGLTLRGVARRAGIAASSIYTQFADKAALIDALLVYEHERVAELMLRASADAGPADDAGVVRAHPANGPEARPDRHDRSGGDEQVRVDDDAGRQRDDAQQKVDGGVQLAGEEEEHLVSFQRCEPNSSRLLRGPLLAHRRGD